VQVAAVIAALLIGAGLLWGAGEHYLVPDGPGLGLELDQDYIERYRV